eukprot:jgi/Chlat1/7527/Chrsp62S07045
MYRRPDRYRRDEGMMHPGWGGPYGNMPPMYGVMPMQMGRGDAQGGVMTYKQFMATLDDTVTPAEAQRKYDEYKADQTRSLKKTYFETHKDKQWLKEKYHPVNLEAALQRRNEKAQERAKQYFEQLSAGSLDVTKDLRQVASNGHAGSKSKHAKDGADEEKRGSDEDKMNESSKEIDIARIAHDLRQAGDLAVKLDIDKGIDDNPLLLAFDLQAAHGSKETKDEDLLQRVSDAVSGTDESAQLDVLLYYLWRVHHLDYYGRLIYEKGSEGSRRRTGRYISLDSSTKDEAEERSRLQKRIDAAWEVRLNGTDPMSAMLGRSKIEAAETAALESSVRKVSDGKFGCGVPDCKKMFHGPEFVKKHVRLKHLDYLANARNKTLDEVYEDNFYSDPNAIPNDDSSAPARSSQGAGASDRIPRIRDRMDYPSGQDRADDGMNFGPGGHMGFPHRPPFDGPGIPLGPGPPHRPGGPMYGDMGMARPLGPHGMHGMPMGMRGMPPHPMFFPGPGAGPMGPFGPGMGPMGMGPMGMGPMAPMGPMFDGGGRGPRRGGPPPPIREREVVMPPPREPRRMREYVDLDMATDDVPILDYRGM